MKQIFCEHPVIIRNPQLKELLITHRCYTTLTGDHYISFAQANYFKYRFPDYQFSPRRFKVTLDNIDRFNVFNEKTGEVFPMFIQVPLVNVFFAVIKRLVNGLSVLLVRMSFLKVFLSF